MKCLHFRQIGLLFAWRTRHAVSLSAQNEECVSIPSFEGQISNLYNEFIILLRILLSALSTDFVVLPSFSAISP